MQWNFEDSRTDRLLMGTAFDITLFFLAVVLIFLIAVLPSSSLTHGVAPGEPLVFSSFYLSGPLALLWIGVFINRWHKTVKAGGKKASPEELTALYSLVNGLIVIGVGGWLLYGAINAYFDKSPREIHFAYVFDKTVVSEGRYEAFQLELSDWNREGERVTMKVTSDLYEAVVAEDGCLRLVTGSGALGHQWIAERALFNVSDLSVERDWRYQCQAAWEQQQRVVDASLPHPGS